MDLLTLTEVVAFVEKKHPEALYFAWDFQDGPAAFQATFANKPTIDPDIKEHYYPLAVTQILIDATKEKPWEYIYKVRRFQNEMLNANAYIDDTEKFRQLREILNIGQGKSDQPWSPNKFLGHVDLGSGKVRNNWEDCKISYAKNIPHILRRNVKEADKIYFLGYRRNSAGKQTEANYEKTRKWISQEMADWCRKTNHSSCWTDHLRKNEHDQPLVSKTICVS